jgi:thioredoxin 1
MQRVFDTVLASSDMSLERVLNAGLPVALIFYDRELPGDLRRVLDELARQYSGRALIVTLNRSDAPQAASRFGVRQLPALVTVRDGKTVASLGAVRQSDVGSYLAHLLGEGPMPGPRAAETGPAPKRTTSATPVTVNENNFDREVLQSDQPVLVDFWAPWCAPCRMVAPTLEKLAGEQSKLKIAKLNVDENPNLASRYRAMSIPTMIVFQGGREVDRWVGAMPENMLRSRVTRWTSG